MTKDKNSRKMSDSNANKSFHQLDVELGTDFSLPNTKDAHRLGSNYPFETKNGKVEPIESILSDGKKKR